MTRIIRQHRHGEAPKRRQRPASSRTRVLHAEQLQTLNEAEQALNAARKQAQVLIQQAEADAQDLRVRAAEEGRAEFARLLSSTQRALARQLEQERAGLTRLAVRIAEKILDEALAVRPERINNIVANCLRRAAAAHRMELRVNPDDQPLVEAELPQLSSLTDDSLLTIKGDAGVARGGCIIVSEHGELDGQLQTQLAAIRRALEP